MYLVLPCINKSLASQHQFQEFHLFMILQLCIEREMESFIFIFLNQLLKHLHMQYACIDTSVDWLLWL